MPTPFISLSRRGNEVDVRGYASASLGTRTKFDQGFGGIFASWKYDSGSRQLEAEVDPYGMFSLFYSETKDGVLVSPSPIQLVAEGARADLDFRALAVFHMLGWYIGEDTPFLHIKVLPPNGRLRWAAGELSVAGSPSHPKASPISRAGAIDEYGRLFSASIRSCCDSGERFIIPLSGGRDSRHILLEAARHEADIDHCITLDRRHGSAGLDPDVECAKLVAHSAAVRHVLVRTLESAFRDQIIVIPMLHFCSDEGAQMLPLADYATASTCVITDGIAGDVLSRNGNFTNRELQSAMAAGRTYDFVDRLLSEFDRISGSSFSDRVGAQPSVVAEFQSAREYLVEQVAQFQSTPDPLSQFLFWTRTRREMSLCPQLLMSRAKAVLCPYLDPSLVEFCASLPAEVTSDGAFHDAVIRSSFPSSATPYDTEMSPRWSRPPIGIKINANVDGILAKRALGVSGAPAVAEYARMLVDRSFRKLHFWRAYRKSLTHLGGAAS